VGVVPEFSTGLLGRTDERETRGTAVAKGPLEEILGTGDTGNSNGTVGAGDDVLEVLGLCENRGVGDSFKRETGESGEGILWDFHAEMSINLGKIRVAC
jgi:hypothetical protein